MDFLVNLFFVSTAYAQDVAAGAAPKGPSLFEMLAMPAGFILIMYFFILRPQQKKAKEHAKLLTGLKKGDEVVTTGGIIGRVRSVSDNFVTIDVGPNQSLKIIKHNVAAMTKQPEAKPAAAPVKA